MLHTKIVCTIGPASESRGVIKQLIKSGMRVARLNFSHGKYSHHQLLIDNIRKSAYEFNQTVAIMQDLQGPRIRIGEMRGRPIELTPSEYVILCLEKTRDQILRQKEEIGKIIPIQYNIFDLVSKGDTILIDDGQIELKVKNTAKDFIEARVVIPGAVGSYKGINVPGIKIPAEVITEKDKQDLDFGLKAGVDFVALSFVSSQDDIITLKKLIKKGLNKKDIKPMVIAKIERAEAIDNLDGIIQEADGIMVARGDLGLELPAEKVPLVQKQIVEKCLKRAKPVIVATQMLDSMIRKPRPTRAEVSDVSSAVIEHSDALMLSGETAYGRFPVKACKMMSKIIKEIEGSPYDDLPQIELQANQDTDEALAHAAWSLSLEVKAKAIVANSISGNTARMISRFRPEVPIVVTAEDAKIERQLILSWGIVPLIIPECNTVDELINKAVKQVKQEKIVKAGNKIIIVSGQPVGRGGTNLVKVHTV